MLTFFKPLHRAILYGILLLLGLYLISIYHYLLFHGLVEIFSIIVAGSIFIISWNSRRLTESSYFIFLGIAFLFVGALDLLHTLTFKGTGILQEFGANLPTQLWIIARYVQSISFLIATFFLSRRARPALIFPLYLAASLILLGSIFLWGFFLDCFLEGTGLTPFKRVSEFIIVIIFVCAAIFLSRHSQEFDAQVLRWLLISILFAIIAELSFTAYEDVYGVWNFVGHYFKLLSFYFIYKAIIETGLMKPYQLLFRNLKQSEEKLLHSQRDLEGRVRQRTAELTQLNENLMEEISDRLRAEDALRESEKKYSQLVENSLTGIYINQDERIVFANNKFTEIHGYSKDEIVGLEWWKLVHPQDRDLLDSFRTIRLSGGDAPVEYEARGLTKEGKTIWLTRRNSLIEYQGKPAILGNVVETTQRKQMEKALEESAQELRHLSSQLLAAQENERKRISQELHDSIGQVLTAAKFSLERKISQMNRKQAPAGILLEDVIAMLQNAIEESRRISMDLWPSILEDLGILPSINWFCRNFEKIYAGIRIEKQFAIQENEIPASRKIVIYRVLQEALNNIAKHSQADHVRLALSKNQSVIEFLIEDNGKGFDRVTYYKGLGLSSMRERVEFSGGAFRVESNPGSGTTIHANWPIQ
jgi:PAS domain S-box-containing protein